MNIYGSVMMEIIRRLWFLLYVALLKGEYRDSHCYKFSAEITNKNGNCGDTAGRYIWKSINFADWTEKEREKEKKKLRGIMNCIYFMDFQIQ